MNAADAEREIFQILAKNDEVDAFGIGKRAFATRNPLCRADVGKRALAPTEILNDGG